MVKKDSLGWPSGGREREEEVGEVAPHQQVNSQAKCGGTRHRSGAELRTRLSDTPREQCHSHGDLVAPPSTYSRICRLLLTIKASAKAWAPVAPTEATCRLQENKDPSAHVMRWSWCAN